MIRHKKVQKLCQISHRNSNTTLSLTGDFGKTPKSGRGFYVYRKIFSISKKNTCVCDLRLAASYLRSNLVDNFPCFFVTGYLRAF